MGRVESRWSGTYRRRSADDQSVIANRKPALTTRPVRPVRTKNHRGRDYRWWG